MKLSKRVPIKRYNLASLLLIASLSLFGTNAAAKVVDKNHTSCVFYHRMSPEKISESNLFPEGIDPSSVCLDCHHYGENHHPVNFVPDKDFQGSGRELYSSF